MKISERWDEDYIKLAKETEKHTGRPICGAKTTAGTPCEWPPVKDSASGRCLRHGGHAKGGLASNQNSRKHGVYVDALDDTELSEAEQIITSLVNTHNLDLNDARVDLLMEDIVLKTMKIRRGARHVKKDGMVVAETIKDSEVTKAHPVIDLMIRLSESRRRDFEALLSGKSATAGGPAPQPLDPCTRDSLIAHVLNMAKDGRGQEAAQSLLETAMSSEGGQKE